MKLVRYIPFVELEQGRFPGEIVNHWVNQMRLHFQPAQDVLTFCRADAELNALMIEMQLP